jgi:hypothetical protein
MRMSTPLHCLPEFRIGRQVAQIVRKVTVMLQLVVRWTGKG